MTTTLRSIIAAIGALAALGAVHGAHTQELTYLSGMQADLKAATTNGAT